MSDKTDTPEALGRQKLALDAALRALESLQAQGYFLHDREGRVVNDPQLYVTIITKALDAAFTAVGEPAMQELEEWKMVARAAEAAEMTYHVELEATKKQLAIAQRPIRDVLQALRELGYLGLDPEAALEKIRRTD